MTMTNTFREHHQRGIFTILEYLEFLEYMELGQFRNFCDVLSLPYKRALARPVIKAFNVCDRYLVKRNDQLWVDAEKYYSISPFENGCKNWHVQVGRVEPRKVIGGLEISFKNVFYKILHLALERCDSLTKSLLCFK